MVKEILAKFGRTLKKIIFLGLICLSILFILLFDFSPKDYPVLKATTDTEDFLVYQANGMFLYDPVNETHTEFLEGWEVWDFRISSNKQLAFSSQVGGWRNLFILDYPYTENDPIQITFSDSEHISPVYWSPDSEYLAILTKNETEDDYWLMIWDGISFERIYNTNYHIGEFEWSVDGRLAFTQYYSNKDGRPDEIYMWDGNEIINVSQNPDGYDRYPTWGPRGELAFLSERNEKYNLYVWDGVSIKNGLPDIGTWQNIAPDQTNYMSDPVWTIYGSISFSGFDKLGFFNQIIEWNEEEGSVLSKSIFDSIGGQTWAKNGNWAYINILNFDNATVFIMDENNNQIIKTNGIYSPAWSDGGRLLFCRDTGIWPNRWELIMWNGEKEFLIINGKGFKAQWSNGLGVYCSHG